MVLPANHLTIYVLLLYFDTANAQNHKYCNVTGDRFGTCIYRNERASFLVPPNVINMQIEVFGGSGGAALNQNNQTEPMSRGLGVHFKAQMTAPEGSKFLMIPPLNGADATKTKSGAIPKRFWGDDPGEGGSPGAARHRRYAGSGATGAWILSPEFRALLCISGGGGSGAYSTDGFSKGGDAAFIPNEDVGYKVVGIGQSGLPQGVSGEGAGKVFSGAVFSGQGGLGIGEQSRRGSAGILEYFRAGNGAHCTDDGSKVYCYPGGGGGSGLRSGGGGGSIASLDYNATASAGSGGGGASSLYQDNRTFTDFQQEHLYTSDPRIILTYEIAKSWSCTVM